MDKKQSERDRESKITITIMIPAYNEANNIGLLLDDVFKQQLGDLIRLEKILVISDGSTDSTEAIVRKLQETEPSLELAVNNHRLGKAACINLANRTVATDYLVLIDADVRLGGHTTLRLLLEDLPEDVGMVGGVPVPVMVRSGLAPTVYMCGDTLRNYIRRRFKGSSNIYAAHGRLLALSKALYSDLEIPSIDQGSKVLSTDQFLYYSCIKRGKKFLLRDQAQIFFNLPETFRDYLRQTVRFMYSAANTKKYFGDTGTTSEFYIPLRVKMNGLLYLFRQRPLSSIAWIGYRLMARSLYIYRRLIRRQEVGAVWDMSESTKSEISLKPPAAGEDMG